MFFRIAFPSALLAALLLAAPSSVAQQADLILYDGKIVTVDKTFRVVQALAVKGDRILAVGTNKEILSLAGPGTTRIALHGKTVLPGLIDSHVHAADASMYEFDHPVRDMETISDVCDYIRERAAALGPGKWISISQVFITRLREQRYPTREELDRAAPENPVVFQTGPDASLNSLALKLSGIDKDFRITDGQPGLIERDAATGEPTGIVRSASRFIKAAPTGKQPTLDDRRNQLKKLLADYNSVGITSIAERDASDEDVDLYRGLKKRSELTCRVFLNLHVDAQLPIDQIEGRIVKAAADPLHTYDNMLWLRGIKSYLDGGMLTGSAYMRQPWGVSKVYSITDPEYRGMRYIPPEKLYAIARLALKNDLQMTAHSVGDGAVHAMIDAYRQVNGDFPVRDKRPCISHSNFMSLEAILEMEKLGVVADLQPAWLERDGATLVRQFGNERLAYFQPYKSLFEHKVIIGGGSDHMQKIGSMRAINPYNPFYGMWVTLARQPRWTDQVLHPEQRLTREQAIRLYTINNAFLTFEEKEKGSLEKGKLADIIVLKKDILTCPVDEVKGIEVERTYLGGRQVYGSE